MLEEFESSNVSGPNTLEHKLRRGIKHNVETDWKTRPAFSHHIHTFLKMTKAINLYAKEI